ncbi:hypothetical protein [Vibrio crassostreae]|uniref:hypothetical protein n=1 Tax=Vibrio crassostreae TaxID=246167 RepID=UPI0003804CBA|nr:hypothetical protein [Vibrio crassostreae]
MSESHPNHKNSTEEILEIVGNEITSKNIAVVGEKYKLHQKLRESRRGRPLSSFAMEFCLTLPKCCGRPTVDQWKSIVRDCVVALANHLRLNEEEKMQFYKQVRAVCHRQVQSVGVRGGHDHVHLLVGKIVKNTVLVDLQKKSSTATLKIAYNNAVAKHLDIDVESYKPYELDRGKKLSQWQHTLHEKEKLENRLQAQIKKWEKAQQAGDIKQLKRQKNRIYKTLEELGVDSKGYFDRLKA